MGGNRCSIIQEGDSTLQEAQYTHYITRIDCCILRVSTTMHIICKQAPECIESTTWMDVVDSVNFSRCLQPLWDRSSKEVPTIQKVFYMNRYTCMNIRICINTMYSTSVVSAPIRYFVALGTGLSFLFLSSRHSDML